MAHLSPSSEQRKNAPAKRPGNPYRIPKPRKGVLWKSRFLPATEEGKCYEFGRVGDAYHVVLTAEYLWLSPELAIPLQTIEGVELRNNDAAVGIRYHNTLSKQDECVFICMRSFLSYRRAAVRQFYETLEHAMNACPSMPSVAPSEAQSAQDEYGLQAGCETCGSLDAALLEYGRFYCVGVWPILGAYEWEPRRRYLCQKHAVRTCLACNVVTGLVGYLGFPGIFVAPVRVWKNVSQLRKAYPDAVLTASTSLVIGIVAPLIAVGLLVYAISRNL